MILDTSAVVAIVAGEPEADAFADALASAPVVRISAATYLESAVVIDGRRSPTASRTFDDLLTTVGVVVVPFDQAQAIHARQAYRDFGKGSGHPARLNFGDCFTYALVRVTGEPLLYKGDDFVHTDVRAAVSGA